MRVAPRAPNEKSCGRFLTLCLAVAAAFSCNHPAMTSEDRQPALVFRSADGRTLTMRDLEGVTGPVRWEIGDGQSVPAAAKRLHEEAREAGGRGQYETAIRLLTKASALAPAWPYPMYDRAYTHLLMNDSVAARADYQRTVDLAPRGFFTAATALDALNREQSGDLPAGIYLAYLSLEWTNDRAAKTALVRQLVQKAPRFAPAWKELALLVDDRSERLATIEKGLAAAPDGETKGILIINKALVLNARGNRPEAIQLLAELALDPTSTLASEHLAKTTLASLLKK
jgi:tetratricopeptide (TPR) repeat protein